MVYSAPRLSPVSAYGRQLLLYAAALSTTSACSGQLGECSTAKCQLLACSSEEERDQPLHAYPLFCPGAGCERRSGIKEEAEGQGTAA